MKKIIKKIVRWFVPDKLLISLLEQPLIIRLRKDPFFKKAYYCKALSGDSNYNICINSDMTVSCNCQDYDGSGHIGDLNNQTLEEIFRGETAQSFRKKLARGRFATPICYRCRELQHVSRKDAAYYTKNYQVPRRGIMVENTVLCKLGCLACDRDKVMKIRGKKSMSLQDIEKVAETVRKYQIKNISFHNLGEPFFSNNVYKELSILRKHNPHVHIWTSTSGLLLDSEKKREAALLVDHIFFSIDGSSQELVSKYQVGGDFKKAYTSMKELVNFKRSKSALAPVIEWKYVIFSWNDKEDAIERAIELAKEAHIDILSFWPGIGETSHVSQRYLHDPYFQQLGEESWKGREIDLRKYFVGFKAFEALGDKGATAINLYRSGMKCDSNGEYKQALEKYKQILNTFEDLEANQGIASVYGQMGKSYESDGNYKNAIKNYIIAYKLFKTLMSPYKERAANDLGRIKYNIGEEKFNSHLNEITKELDFTLESLHR